MLRLPWRVNSPYNLRPMRIPKNVNRRRCAVCRGTGQRSDGSSCRGCAGAGEIPAAKIRERELQVWQAVFAFSQKRASGKVH